jgi:branched-chain amino acid transport system ATP-binding protein
VAGRSGEIRFEGARIDALPAHRIARLGLGYVPEDRRIFTDLTVLENLEVGRQPPRGGAAPWTPRKLFELFPSLGPMQDRLGGRMSGGEQQMLALARTLMGNPRAILLDEPAEGLAPLVVAQIADAISALKAEGLCVVLSEQNLRFARRVADRACLLEKGRILAAGPLEAVEREYAVSL